jgi:hypothetical protein
MACGPLVLQCLKLMYDSVTVWEGGKDRPVSHASAPKGALPRRSRNRLFFVFPQCRFEALSGYGMAGGSAGSRKASSGYTTPTTFFLAPKPPKEDDKGNWGSDLWRPSRKWRGAVQGDRVKSDAVKRGKPISSALLTSSIVPGEAMSAPGESVLHHSFGVGILLPEDRSIPPKESTCVSTSTVPSQRKMMPSCSVPAGIWPANVE